MTKHFWINNPEIKSDGYNVNFNGFISKLDIYYEFVSVTYNEIVEIINKQTKPEKYSKCKEIFNKRFPQSKEEMIELPIDEQSRLEEIFSTHKNL